MYIKLQIKKINLNSEDITKYFSIRWKIILAKLNRNNKLYF